MSLDIAQIIGMAGSAWTLYQQLKDAAVAQGMDPDEFDASVERECSRLDGWQAKTDADEDKVRP